MGHISSKEYTEQKKKDKGKKWKQRDTMGHRITMGEEAQKEKKGFFETLKATRKLRARQRSRIAQRTGMRGMTAKKHPRALESDLYNRRYHSKKPRYSL
tara:strand:+ start:250 stop:546 length:297 start_codon:yes stop_codon:yes gene_type:complete